MAKRNLFCETFRAETELSVITINDPTRYHCRLLSPSCPESGEVCGWSLTNWCPRPARSGFYGVTGSGTAAGGGPTTTDPASHITTPRSNYRWAWSSWLGTPQLSQTFNVSSWFTRVIKAAYSSIERYRRSPSTGAWETIINQGLFPAQRSRYEVLP